VPTHAFTFPFLFNDALQTLVMTKGYGRTTKSISLDFCEMQFFRIFYPKKTRSDFHKAKCFKAANFYQHFYSIINFAGAIKGFYTAKYQEQHKQVLR